MIKPRPARYLRSARLKAGLTQRSLADRAGIPQPTLAAIEAGRQEPRYGTLERLLRACGYDLDLVPRIGVGVDRSLHRELLELTPGERVTRAGPESRVLEMFSPRRLRPRARRV